jgi:hypothetical protein
VTVRPRLRLAMAAVAVAVATGGAFVALAVLREHEPAGRPLPAASGDLLTRVDELVRSMPGPDSNSYDPPTRDEASALARAFDAMREGDLDEAAGLAASLGFTVQPFTDTATGHRLLIMAERRPADGSSPHGWGLFAWSPASTSHLVVEVAHPLDDIDTPPVGVQTFRLANAQALLVAGASRFAGVEGTADAAHAPGTPFDAVHRALLARGVVVFQPHGFESDQHPDYGDIVVSSGVFPPEPLARSVASALAHDRFTVCLYDGEHCSALGGTTNVQGASVREAGGHFLHIEMAASVRASPRLRNEVARAVARAAG